MAVGCFGMGQGVSPLLTTPTRYHVEDSWYIKGPPLSPWQGPDPAKNLPAPMCCCGMKLDSQNIWLALFITESVICCSVLDIAGFDACVWPQPATVTSEPFKIEGREREKCYCFETILLYLPSLVVQANKWRRRIDRRQMALIHERRQCHLDMGDRDCTVRGYKHEISICSALPLRTPRIAYANQQPRCTQHDWDSSNSAQRSTRVASREESRRNGVLRWFARKQSMATNVRLLRFRWVFA